jgi:CBS domain-containing protein
MTKRATRAGRSLKSSSIPVGEILNTEVAAIEPNATASYAWSQMRRRGISHFVVMENGKLRGVLSERDLGGRTGAGIRTGRIVQDLMTPNTVSVEPNTTLRESANLMSERQIGSLPVLDGGRLVGVATATDVFNELGRSPIRVPLPGWLPKAVKREAGRAAIPVPAHIRVLGANLNKAKREEIRRKLGAKLGKFADSIERVSVRVKDVNGPRGGVDQVCSIKVVLSDFPSVVFEAQHKSVDAAVGAAITGTERAVRRRLQRSRKPNKTPARPKLASAD